MSTQTAEAEAPETTPAPDGPLLDLTDAGVKKFIKQAKARGYVTMDELNKVLPSGRRPQEAPLAGVGERRPSHPAATAATPA